MLHTLQIGNLILPNNVVVAPLAGVSDYAYRLMLDDMGAGLLCTEMISAKALFYGDKKTGQLLRLTEKTPTSAQIFGSDPISMEYAAKYVCQSGAAILDINMGCPVPKIVSNGDGSALMKNPKLAGQIIQTVVQASTLPVTVKMRIGFDEINIAQMAHIAQESGASTITVHGRTRTQMYSGKANFDAITIAKQSVSIPVIANGDIFTPRDAKTMIDQTGCDGIMLARGIMSNPWLLRDTLHYLQTGEIFAPPTLSQRMEAALKHTRLLVQTKGEKIGILESRGHLCRYIKGISGSAQLKTKLQGIKTLLDAEQIINAIAGDCD